MAIDADAAERTLEGGDDGTSEPDRPASEGTDVARDQRGIGRALAACLAIVAGLTGLSGWLGYQHYQSDRIQQRHNMFLRVARQGALNLTTISYTEAGTDVARILDSATGGFHDEFQQRSQSFIAVVNRAQSKSVGTIVEAAVESEQTDEARVLVAVNVSTSLAGTPEPQPRAWRMRVTVQRAGNDAKISRVEFVP
jgi:Mce-associated membrane protein